MITPAELTSEPELEELPGGHLVYTARADLSPSGRGIVAVMLPLVAGVALPYQRGDVVLVGLDGGTGYVLGHFASATEHDGHTMIVPRAGKDVRIGGGSGAWEALALHAKLSQDLMALKSIVEQTAVAAHMAALELVTPGSGTTWRAEQVDFDAINGGDAAAAKGRVA